MIVGIDFSLNCTGICIRVGARTVLALIMAEHEFSHGQQTQLMAIKSIKTLFFKAHRDDFFSQEVEHQTRAEMITQIILDARNEFEEDVEQINVENFSFGSKTNILTMIAAGKYEMGKHFAKQGWNNIHLVSPMTVKKLAKEELEKGTLSKSQLVDRAIKAGLKINYKTRAGSYHRWVTDLADAYWLTLYQN